MIYIYIFFFAVLTFFTTTSMPLESKNSMIAKSFSEFIYFFVSCSILILSVFVGINSDRSDYENYLSAFQDAKLLNFEHFFDYAISQHQEVGYNYFQSFIKSLGGNATIYFIIFCFVSFIYRYKFYNYFVSKPDLGICFLGFFVHEFLRKDCVQIRNGFASSIVLFALIFLYKNQKARFCLMIFIASCFHTVALVALPLVCIKQRYLRKKDISIYVLLISLFISLFFKIRTFLLMLGAVNLIPSRLATYLNWSTYLTSMSIFNPLLLKQLIILAWVMKNRQIFFCDKKIYFLSQIYLISTVYYLIFRDFEILAARFGSLFYAVEGPLVVLIFEKFYRKKYEKKILICLLYFCLLIYNLMTYQDFLGWNPVFK